MDKASLGQYGVYHVAAMLHRQGYIAVTTSRNTKAVDILAFNALTAKSVGIQVKTVRQKRKDINRENFPGITIVPDSLEAFDLPAIRTPFVFVYVPEDAKLSPRFFVIPPEKVKEFIRIEWERYEKKSRHRKPIDEIKKRKQPVWFSLELALPYENKWENLGLGPA